MERSINRWAALALVAALHSGCGGAPDEPDVDLTDRWELTRLVTDDLDWTFDHDSGGPTMTLTLGEQAISGCEVIEWETEVDGTSVRFHDFEVGYMRSCPPGRMDRLDGKYADYLADVTHAERTENTMTFTGDDLTLTYRRLDDQGEPLD